MSEVLAMLLDWATKEGRDLQVFTLDFDKFFFDRCILGGALLPLLCPLQLGIRVRVNVLEHSGIS